MSIKVRPLQPTDIPKLPIDVPPTSIACVVAYDDSDDTIKGVWPAQLVIHTEPVWLDASLRSGRVGLEMFAGLMALLGQQDVNCFYAFAASPEVADYLERIGMQPKPYLVYEGFVPPLPPSLKEGKKEEKECPQSQLDLQLS